MSYVEVLNSSKGGPACSRSIDLQVGCPENQCLGCYAQYTSRMGSKFFTNPVVREFNDEVFRKSIKKTIKQGYSIARYGKHTDCGSDNFIRTNIKAINIASEEGFRFVFVSKSLGFNEEIAKSLKRGNHILHISLGMKTKAKPNEDRLNVFEAYSEYGVNSKLRITDDITKPLDNTYNYVAKYYKNDTIVTPLRLRSKDEAKEYNADLDKYSWTGGYYRPKVNDKSWDCFQYYCGEVDGITKCCNCKTL